MQGTDSEIDEKITVKAKDKVVVSTEDEEVTTIVSSTKSTQVTNDSPWQDPTYFSSFGKELMFIATCMLAQLLNQAGQTHALCIMNVLSKSFNSEANNQAWLMASFPLAAGSFILISGRLGDIYGLKKMLIVGYVIVIVWSIFLVSPNTLIATRFSLRAVRSKELELRLFYQILWGLLVMFIRSVHSGRTLLLVSSAHVLQQAACLVDYSGG